LTDQAELKADVIEITVSGTFKTEHVFNTPDGILGRAAKGREVFLALMMLYWILRNPVSGKANMNFRKETSQLPRRILLKN